MCLISGLVLIALLHGSSSQKDGVYKESCGNRTYDYDRDRVCCKYQEDEVYLPTELCINGSTDDPYETCGPEGPLFDFRFNGCCNGVRVFDKPDYKCCAGSANGVNTAIPLDTPCCNGAALQQNQLCCEDTFLEGGKAFPKGNPRDNACCVYSDQQGVNPNVSTYNDGCAYCSGGKVKPIPADFIPSFTSCHSASGSVMTRSAALHTVSVITLLVCS